MSEAAERPMGFSPALLFYFGLIALLVASPVLATGSWYGSHDGIRLPYLVYQFNDAFKAGILYPRWLPEMMSGYGYPTFVFYQPGYFYFTLPFALFYEPVLAVYLSLIAMLMLGAWGAYQLSRYYNNPWISALVAFVFLMHPYLARNIFIRGAYPEAYAQLLLPWGVYFALRFTDAMRARLSQREICWWGAGLFAAALAVMVTHPYIAMFYMPFLAGLLFVRALTPDFSAHVLIAGALLMALAVVVSAPYWLPLFQLKEFVRYHSAVAGGYDPVNSLINPARVFSIWPNSPPGLHRLLALIGFACAWRNVTLRYVAAAFVFLLFMMSSWSLPVWVAGHEVLKYVQFAWRITAVAGTVGLIGIIQLGPPLMKLWQKRSYMAYAAAAFFSLWVLYICSEPFYLRYALRKLVVPSVPQAMYWNMFNGIRGLHEIDYYADIRKQEERGRISMASANEFMPQQASAKNLPNRLAEPVPAIVVGDETEKSDSVSFLPETTRYYFAGDVKVDDPARVVINQFYFPGWRVTVDGVTMEWVTREAERAMTEADLPDTAGGKATYDENGRMLLYFDKPGIYRVKAYYEGPPGWRGRNAVIALLTGLMAWAFYKVVANRRVKP